MVEKQSSTKSKFASGFFRVLIFIAPAADLIRIPWLFQAIWRRVTRARPLTDRERQAGMQVLGERGIRYDDVRVGEGGPLASIFKRNGRRAFTTYHIINLPVETSLAIVVHELAHVFQYEHAGGRIMWQALHAQASVDDAYDYGGPKGLKQAHDENKPFAKFNREQQAHVIEGYYRYVVNNEKPPDQESLDDEQRKAYEFYLGELLAGRA
jgi:hypothetical protein